MEPMRDILRRLPAAARDTPAALAPALAWQLAAGPRLAALAGCEGLAAGVLGLRAADPEAARQILSVERELCAALTRLLGAPVARLAVTL